MSLLHPTDAPDPTGPSPVTSWVSTLARWLLGGVLIASGAIKVVDLEDSATTVLAYQVLPEPLAVVVGTLAPFVGLLLGLVLLAGAVTRIAAIVSAALMTIFLVVVGSAAARGLNVECGCFGGGGEVAPGQAQYGLEALGVVGLLVVALWLTARPRSRFSFDRGPAEDELTRTDEREASLT